jgi:hypothetical protein
VDSSSALGKARLRVLSDGRVDTRDNLFHTGPVLVQTNGAIVIGRGSEQDPIRAGPFLRFILRDGPNGEQGPERDSSFLDDHSSDWTGETVCVSAALAQDGKVWAWLRPFSLTNDSPARLARFLPTGALDPAFQPPQPILAEDPGERQALVYFLGPLPNDRVLIFQVRPQGWWRLNGNGTSDLTFDPPAVLDQAALANPAVIVPLPAGEMLVSVPQIINDAAGWQFELLRLSPEGTISPDFHSQLPLRFKIGSVLMQPNGRILATGSSSENGAGSLPIIRLNSDGSRDSSLDLAPLAAAETLSIAASGFESGKAYWLQTSSKIHAGIWETIGSYRGPLVSGHNLELKVFLPGQIEVAPRFWRLVGE